MISQQMLNRIKQSMPTSFGQQQAQPQYQMPFGYQLAQMPELPQTQGTSYNPIYAQLVRQMQLRQMPQQGGNYLFGQSFIQPSSQPQYNQPQFDYTRAMMGRF